MNKKEYCLKNDTIATYGITNTMGLVIKGIEHGIDDYIYFMAVGGTYPTYHKSKIYDGQYFRFGNMKINLNECIRV